MMTKLFYTTAAFIIGLIATAQVSENRNVNDFSKLKASQGIKVIYTISSDRSIKVETDDNEKLKMIKTEVDGETLNIFVDTENKSRNSSKKRKKTTINGVNFKIIKVYVSGQDLTEIKASSSADVKIQNLNKTDNLKMASSSSGSISGSFECNDLIVDVSSSGDINGTITAKSISVEASSSGDVTLDGNAAMLEIKASSSADCNLKKLTVENTTVKASSSAAVSVTATKSLDATASSSADINYYGNPSDVKKYSSSSGSVNRK